MILKFFSEDQFKQICPFNKLPDLRNSNVTCDWKQRLQACLAPGFNSTRVKELRMLEGVESAKSH